VEPEYNFEKYGIGVADITAEVEKLIRQGSEATECQGIFLVRATNHWIELAKTRPIPKMLFSEFWFEGELCILFADTN